MSTMSLVMADRERVGREASPSAAILDSQSVRTADQRGARKATMLVRRSAGASAHILTDTDGRLLAVHVRGADIRDRDGGKGCPKALASALPLHAARLCRWKLCRPPCRMGKGQDPYRSGDHPPQHDRQGFEVLPRRWVVERTFAWILKNRRFARDYGQLTTCCRNPHRHRGMRNTRQALAMSESRLLKHALINES